MSEAKNGIIVRINGGGAAKKFSVRQKLQRANGIGGF
jgi:hypothetical protein